MHWRERGLIRVWTYGVWRWSFIDVYKAFHDLVPTLLSSLISYHIFSQMLCWPYELFPEKSMFTPFSMHLLRNSSLACEQCPLIYLLIQAFIRNTF